jgi:hypothetical protein
VLKIPLRRWDQFFKNRWCAFRFRTWGTASTGADSFSGLLACFERASSSEVGDQLAFAQISLWRHFRFFQHNRPFPDMPRARAATKSEELPRSFRFPPKRESGHAIGSQQRSFSGSQRLMVTSATQNN